MISTQRRKDAKTQRHRWFSAVSLCLCVFVLNCLLSAVNAHDGEDHSAPKNVAAATGPASRTAERNIQTNAGQFQAKLTQTPADPRAGEAIQFTVTLSEKVEGGFAGALERAPATSVARLSRQAAVA